MSYEEIVREIARLHKDNPAAGEVCWRIVMQSRCGCYKLWEALAALQNGVKQYEAAGQPPAFTEWIPEGMEDLADVFDNHLTDSTFATMRTAITFFKPLL